MDTIAIPYTDNLETARLTTRFLTQNDAAAWEEYCGDPLATKYTAIPDKTPAEMSQTMIAFTVKRYAEDRLGLQALISKETGELVGMCGIMVQEVNGQREIEVGYHLLRRHWGKGYAIEAAQMFRDYGFEHNFADSIVSIVHPENEASKKVAMRNGMKLVDAEAMFRGEEYNLFRITRDEWRARP